MKLPERSLAAAKSADCQPGLPLSFGSVSVVIAAAVELENPGTMPPISMRTVPVVVCVYAPSTESVPAAPVPPTTIVAALVRSPFTVPEPESVPAVIVAVPVGSRIPLKSVVEPPV